MKLAKICAYSLPDKSRLEAASQRDGSVLWAIRLDGNCMDCEGNWNYEPQPSSRTEEFFRRFRFPSPEAAYAVWARSCGQDEVIEVANQGPQTPHDPVSGGVHHGRAP